MSPPPPNTHTHPDPLHHHPISLCLQTKQPQPPPPSSQSPLSCPAVLHKYINLLSASACVCVCARVWVGGERWHIDDRLATPQADLFHVSPDHRRSVFTHQARSVTWPTAAPPPDSAVSHQGLSPWRGETRGQKLGLDLEVVVPDWLSDLTDSCRPDGICDQRSEVKKAIKKSHLTPL